MRHAHLRLVWTLFALIALLLIVLPVLARPRFIVQGDAATIVLHDESCTLTAQVTNLPLRATWLEDDKVVEGCWSVNGMDVVTLYFEDRTVVALPKQHFARIGST